MLIGCTKALLEFLKATPVKREGEVDPLFSWTAHLIMLNRRKTLVAVNDATKCCFILHGLTAKQLPKLPELMMSGIRAMLESEYIAPDIIEKYLEDCGRELVLTTTLRSEISYCNMACGRVKRFSEILIPGDLLQKPFLSWLNEDFIGKFGYRAINELLISALSEHYGTPVQSAEMAELEVELHLCTPCKRMLLVPTDLNFHQLHSILQGAFAWKDCHLHQFILKKDSMGRPKKIVRPPYDVTEDFSYMGIETVSSTEMTVKEAFTQHKNIKYEYDFGDCWIHTVKLKKWIKNCDSPYPKCIDAVGDTPVEDCGGPWGFAEKLEILSNPAHPDYEKLMEWTGGKFTKPLDLKWINFRLQDTYRRCIPVVWD